MRSVFSRDAVTFILHTRMDDDAVTFILHTRMDDDAMQALDERLLGERLDRLRYRYERRYGKPLPTATDFRRAIDRYRESHPVGWSFS